MSNKKFAQIKPHLYLEMWLSEQIPIEDWIQLLKERPDVNDLYKKHLEENNG